MSEPIRAPELDAGFGWLNTDRPLRFDEELRGQVVVLDFWTYCCINCIHILPDLAFLEHRYQNEPVTFLGVHSAKFTNEASPDTIRAAILRYEIRHPVIVDQNMTLWRKYAVRSWPTVVVVDSTGVIVTTVAGEGNREPLDAAVSEALAQGRRRGTLADGPLNLRREADVPATSGMAFPGKVLADAVTGCLYVADSNHNRIVIASLPDLHGRARVIRVVGTGSVGRDDGPADRATFHHPQGLAVVHGRLYVADTENHLIREVDLSSFEVRTVVGTGVMTNDRAGGAMGAQQGLNSPWDLTAEGSTLYVAMAGIHQIWRIDLPVGFARALAGTGRENLADGPTETAALAQPSGICIANGTIYFADSEVSAIRGIDMAAERVFTVIGQGLFSFGDVDGAQPHARLQHPLGVAAWRNSLIVADTYNHKIKVVEPRSRSVRTLYGSGAPGISAPDGGPAFFEPGGVSVLDDQLFVADTNNHRIVCVDLKSHAWREVILDGLTASPPLLAGEGRGEGVHLRPVEPQSVTRDSDIELAVALENGGDVHLNPDAPWSLRVRSDGATLAQQTGTSTAWPLMIRVPAASVTEAAWEVTASFAVCTNADRGLCRPVELGWSVPIRVGGGGSRITLAAPLPSDLEPFNP